MLKAAQSALAAFALVTLLAACQSQPPSPPQGEPILSLTTREGRGVPNGRSDSRAPYWQSTELQLTTDPEYGRSSAKPIRTGSAFSRGHILFLNALRGPHGEPVEYERKGACCRFEDKSLPLGGGLLDVYRVWVDGADAEVLLYVDMYRRGTPQIPAGFTARQQAGNAI